MSKSPDKAVVPTVATSSNVQADHSHCRDCCMGTLCDDAKEEMEDSNFWRRLQFARSLGIEKSWVRNVHADGRLVSYPISWMDGFEKKFFPEDPGRHSP